MNMKDIRMKQINRQRKRREDHSVVIQKHSKFIVVGPKREMVRILSEDWTSHKAWSSHGNIYRKGK